MHLEPKDWRLPDLAYATEHAQSLSADVKACSARQQQ